MINEIYLGHRWTYTVQGADLPSKFQHLLDCLYAIGWEVFLDKIFRNSSLEHQNTYPFNVYEDLHIHIHTKIHM